MEDEKIIVIEKDGNKFEITEKLRDEYICKLLKYLVLKNNCFGWPPFGNYLH